MDSIVTSKNLPTVLPDVYKTRVTHAVATQFTGLAAEAWAKETVKPTQIRTQGTQQGIIDWCRAKFLSHAYVQERFNALLDAKWDQNKESLVTYNEKHKVLQAEAKQQNATLDLQHQ